MSAKHLKKIKASRVHYPADQWVGEFGTLFYDEDTGDLRIADGITPGGNLMMPDLVNGFGNLRVGNVIITGNLTVQGNTTTVDHIVSNSISSTTGNLTVTDTASFSGTSIFTGNASFLGNTVQEGPLVITGNTTITGYVDIKNSNLSPAHTIFSIDGSVTNATIPSITSGFILQVTGKDDVISIITNDSFGAGSARPAYLGRRARGTPLAPSAVQSGDILLRLVSTGWANTNYAAVGTRIDSVATETFTDTTQGTKLVFGAVRTGTNVYVESTTIDANGLQTNNITCNNTTISNALTFSDGTSVTSASIRELPVSVTGPSYTVTSTDTYVGVNYAGAVDLTLPQLIGKRVTIKDESGNAANNTITITPVAGQVEGQANVTITVNWMSLSLICNAAGNWFIV